MDYDGIWVSEEDLNTVFRKLEKVKTLLSDDNLKLMIDSTMEILQGKNKAESVNVRELIKNKMIITKYSNPDLNFKLYKLLRRLENKKIDEDEAMRIYSTYEKE